MLSAVLGFLFPLGRLCVCGVLSRVYCIVLCCQQIKFTVYDVLSMMMVMMVCIWSSSVCEC